MLISVLIKRVTFEIKYNYELFVGTNKTVHYTCIWVSVGWDSTINTLHSIIILIPGPHCHNRQSMVTGKQRNQDGVKRACLYFRESEM